MAGHSLPGEPPVPLILRRSARARRISLRVSQLDGRVTLTLPPKVPESEAVAFALEKEGWIRGHLQARQDDVRVAVGAEIPIEGVPRRILAGNGRRVQLLPEGISVPPQAAGPRLQGWLRDLARDRLTSASDSFAQALGRPYARITLRDTRSRWGSCSSQGGLMYSWRLIMAPRPVQAYVAAHEACHLVEMNHSDRFWAVVARICPDYDAHRVWLKENGGRLHRHIVV